MQLSGNKVRKLEFLVADAVAEGADCIITIGGVQSNHCRATAVAAKYSNLDCYLILRTSKVSKQSNINGAGAFLGLGLILLDLNSWPYAFAGSSRPRSRLRWKPFSRASGWSTYRARLRRRLL